MLTGYSGPLGSPLQGTETCMIVIHKCRPPVVIVGLLLTLANSPFEPIDQISLKHLTLKTVFLLAVCSANRVHELKALDARPAFCEFTPRGVTLRTNPTFRPKSVRENNMQRVLHFSLLSGQDADPDGAWESVCVVRTLCRYMEVTKPIRSGTNQLICPVG